MKKILTATLAMIMLCSMLASCGSKQNPEPSGTASTSDSGTANTNPSDTDDGRPIEEGMKRYRYDFGTVICDFRNWGDTKIVSGVSMYLDIPEYLKEPKGGNAKGNMEHNFLRWYDDTHYRDAFTISVVYEISDDFVLDETINDRANIGGSWSDMKGADVSIRKTDCGYTYVLYESNTDEMTFCYVFLRPSDNYLVKLEYFDDLETRDVLTKILESVRFVDSNV